MFYLQRVGRSRKRLYYIHFPYNNCGVPNVKGRLNSARLARSWPHAAANVGKYPAAMMQVDTVK